MLTFHKAHVRITPSHTHDTHTQSATQRSVINPRKEDVKAWCCITALVQGFRETQLSPHKKDKEREREKETKSFVLISLQQTRARNPVWTLITRIWRMLEGHHTHWAWGRAPICPWFETRVRVSISKEKLYVKMSRSIHSSYSSYAYGSICAIFLPFRSNMPQQFSKLS